MLGPYRWEKKFIVGSNFKLLSIKLAEGIENNLEIKKNDISASHWAFALLQNTPLNMFLLNTSCVLPV